MSDRPWHKRYHSDALNGYMSLSLEERGAYTTILDLLYDRWEPLVENERLIAGYLGVSLRKARSIIESLISKGKIYRTKEGRISNHRFEKELENELKTSRKHAENGLKGARKSHENKKKDKENNKRSVAGPDDISGLNQKPEVRNQIIGGGGSACARGDPDQDDFDQVISAVGIDISKTVSMHWLGSEPRLIIENWKLSGLSIWEITDEIRSVMRNKHAPPNSLRYFEPAMKRRLGLKSSPKLEAIECQPRKGQGYAERLDDLYREAGARLAANPF